MRLPQKDLQYVNFETELGWMVAVGRGAVLTQLTAGHETEDAALANLNQQMLRAATRAAWCPELVARLQAFAEGADDMFLDVAVDLEHTTAFQRRVIHHCRRISLGQTLSYGRLASLAESPGAARAVGNTMAGNRCPLVVPCHRVVNADGSLGNYSGPQGISMKARLLALEQQAVVGAFSKI
jgi:methylated-DNA-[protein]-cysteine S-methyltransferase